MPDTVNKTFRLTNAEVDQLKEIADARECTQTDALRFALQKGVNAMRGDGRNDDGNGAVTAALLDQLKVKDEQISRLQTLVDQAQHLQAAAMPQALESSDQKVSRRWWRFWERG